MYRWINGRDPRPYGQDFGLWTRPLVAGLIERKCAIRLGVSAVGEPLAKLGLTSQKPLQRAYQRDPEAIEAWRRERYPAFARQAKASGGEVYLWDESGFRADSVHGKTWGIKGQTPVVELRHSAATELLQAGVDCSVIALWLGHESTETTQIYLHAHLKLKEAALVKLKPYQGGNRIRFRPNDRLLAFLEAL